MGLIQQLIKKMRDKVTENVYYGDVANLSFINDETNAPCVIYSSSNRGLKMIKLTDTQRKNYLKNLYADIKDLTGRDTHLNVLINNNVRYFRVPSLGNRIIPYLPLGNTAIANLIGDGDVVVDVRKKHCLEQVKLSK